MKKGITLTEIMVVIGILMTVLLISVPSFVFFQKRSSLDEDSKKTLYLLRLAQNKTLASEDSSQYGIYFDESSLPHQLILFKGESFSSRDISSDKVYAFSELVEISEINLGGASEVVFEKITGFSSQLGFVSLRLKSDPEQTRTIYIEDSGLVSFESSGLPGNGRIADTRHMHFEYTRFIDTATERVVLQFEGGVNKEIIILDNLQEDNFYWEGEVDVVGELQVLKIHTHILNDPYTLFCVHRDRRYNNKALTISISGDISGSLADYTADGSEVSFGSIYVNYSEAQ